MDDCETADKEAGRYCKQCGEFSFQPNKNRYGDRCRLRLAQLQLLKHVYSIPSSKAKDIKQGCHGQGKISGKCIFFQVREKSGNFLDGQGNLERTWKAREKSGNLKINGYGRQSSEHLFILFKRGKDLHSHDIV